MSERAPISEPTPESEADRQSIEAGVSQMEESEAREIEMMNEELMAGDAPQEIMAHFGGPEGARSKIGEEATQDLQKAIKEGAANPKDTMENLGFYDTKPTTTEKGEN